MWRRPYFLITWAPGSDRMVNFLEATLVPYVMSMFLVVHADGYDFYFSLVEFFCMPRQTAQLSHAKRSPISAVEIQEDPASTLIRQLQNGPVLILQDEVRRRLAHGRCDLRFWITTLRRSQASGENAHGYQHQ